MSLATVQATETPAVKTPLVEVTHAVSSKLPCRVFFKNEMVQPSGSFKLRGIGHLINELLKEARRLGRTQVRVYALSGGNAGLAAAYLARFYGVPCTVVVPTVAMAHVVARLEEFGAQVVLHGQSINEADECVREIIAGAPPEVHAVYCHPFDNALIWEGHLLMMDEVFAQLGPADAARVRAVVCSVGGGGLYNGIMRGLRRNGSLADCVLVETAQAPTLSTLVRAGEVVRLLLVRLVATLLACSYVSQPTLDLFCNCAHNVSHIAAVDDVEAVRGCVSFYRDFGVAVEPACGAAVLVVYNQLPYLELCLPDLASDDIVVVVVCGGLCVTEASMALFRRMVREASL